MSGGFDQLQIDWNLYVELQKEGVKPCREEKESLYFLQKMATAHQMDINMIMRNTILSWKSQFQAEHTQLPQPTIHQNTWMILPSFADQGIYL